MSIYFEKMIQEIKQDARDEFARDLFFEVRSIGLDYKSCKKRWDEVTKLTRRLYPKKEKDER